VLERVDAGLGDVRVALQVPGRVELGDRRYLPGAAPLEEIRQQRAGGRGGMMGAVPGQVEMRARRAVLRLAEADVVQQRIDPGAGDGGVLLQIPGGVEI
jgi:hypothetical protein